MAARARAVRPPRWRGAGGAPLLLLLLLGATAVVAQEGPRSAQDKVSLGVYKKLFEVKRVEQMNALKSLVELRDLQQQYKIIDIMLQGLFKVLEESRALLASANVLPSGPIPEDVRQRDAFSHVVENVAFFGDVLLRFPRIVHGYVDGSAERLALLRWGIHFCNGTGVFVDGVHSQLLSLASQELGLVEKSPDYHNPFQLDEEKMLMDSQILHEAFRKEEKRRKQAEKREKRKGPRITRPRTEL